MPAIALNLEIEQGATFSQVINVGVSLAGATVRAQVRRIFNDVGALGFAGSYGNVGDTGYGLRSTELLAQFTGTIVDGAGNTTLGLAADVTALLRAPRWTRADERKVPLGVWELEAVNGLIIARTHQGNVTLSRRAYG